MDYETPKLRRCNEKAKITIYFDREIDELYRTGKQNGWDTSEIVRKAAAEALRTRADILKEKADKSA